MTKQIVVGFDGFESSEAAVQWAAYEALERSVPLHIVTSYHIPVGGDPILGWTATETMLTIKESSDEELRRIAKSTGLAFPGLEVQMTTSHLAPATALVQLAEADDIIVVGASKHEGAAAFWLGSTTRSVVHHSPCPVVVVYGAATMGRPNRVVVGVDGSPASDDALRWAGDAADRYGVPLEVVHGWMYPYPPVDTGSTQAAELLEIDAACTLERSLEVARERFGVDVVGHLVETSPVAALLRTVQDGDLLVVGSRGRGAIKSALLGSTVHQVLDRSSVPVVVVRPSAS